jgi:hypothetical protein
MDFIKKIEDFELIPDNWFDKYAGMPTLFTLIVIFQGCFGGMGVVQTPAALTNAVNNPAARGLFVCAIAYTATSDIETAVFCTVVFFVLLHLLRTEEEKKATPTYL